MTVPLRTLAFLVVFLSLSAYAATKGKVVDDKYHSARDWFTVTVPKSFNWAGVPFSVSDDSVNQPGVGNFDLVAFWVKDFGEVFIASVRHIPDHVLEQLKQDSDRIVLSHLAMKALYDWRGAGQPNSLPSEPKVIEDTYVDTPYGEAILRVYMAEKGSLLVRATGRPRVADTFDTFIVVMLVKQKNQYIYVIAENDGDSDGTDRAKFVLKGIARAFFSSMDVHR